MISEADTCRKCVLLPGKHFTRGFLVCVPGLTIKDRLCVLQPNDHYRVLKTPLKAEIDPEAWVILSSDTLRPLEKPKNGSIALKMINHLGDEEMKVFKVG